MKAPASIGLCVRLLCDMRGWTQAELGTRCGLSRTFINDVVNERCNPSIENMQIIFRAFDLEAAVYLYKVGRLQSGTIVLLGGKQHER